MNARPTKDTFENFQTNLVASSEEIASLLPSTITWDRYRNTVIAAVKANPELLLIDQKYLKKSITQAAVDGLMPDGKEGVIIIQNEKVKVQKDGKTVEEWIKTCRWQPMLLGIRKRARELSGMIIDAKVVYKNDVFDWEEGDTPYIHHKPVALDEDTGPMVGVYAHFRLGNDILHREVMRKSQVMAVKEISKQPGGLMWTKFEEEAWKKSAVRRGIKTVPCHPQLETVIKRFDDMHDITPDRDPMEGPIGRRLAPPPPPAIKRPEAQEADPVADAAIGVAEPADSKPIAVRGKRAAPPPPPADKKPDIPTPPADASTIVAEITAAKTEQELIDVQQKHSSAILNLESDDRDVIFRAIEKATARLSDTFPGDRE